MMKKVQETKKMSNLVIEGVVVSAKYGATKFDDKNKYRLSLYSENMPYDDIKAFDTVGEKMTPSWYKEQEGYINLNSIFDIPVMDIAGNRIDFDAWLGTGKAVKSKVKVSVRQKEGALYPIAIKVIEEGEEFDPFANL